jgi:hypothetical protein
MSGNGLPRLVQIAKGNECSAYAIKEVRFARRFAGVTATRTRDATKSRWSHEAWKDRQRLCGELIR